MPRRGCTWWCRRRPRGRRSTGCAPCPRARRRVRDEERLHLAVRREERLHVDDEVLLERQALDRLDVDRLRDVEILDQRLAGEAVAAVDAHRVRAADAVRAGAAERQRAVDLPLDLVQGVEHAVGRVQLDVVVDPARLLVHLGIEAPDDEGDEERLDAGVGRDGLGLLGGVGVGALDDVGDRGHQYFLSIGWYRVMTTGFQSRRMWSSECEDPASPDRYAIVCFM